jgi:hypothetical protein
MCSPDSKDYIKESPISIDEMMVGQVCVCYGQADFVSEGY